MKDRRIVTLVLSKKGEKLMKVLVTGFTGKVGFEVAQKLKDKDVSMVCAVRCSGQRDRSLVPDRMV